MFRSLLLFLSFAAVPAAAQDISFICNGIQPKWRLKIDGAKAEFHFPELTEMEVKLTTTAEGQDWPRALTLIGDADTGIVLLHRRNCGTGRPFEAQVLTQRRQLPILLTGCCTVAQ